jgi:hypothetical protein
LLSPSGKRASSLQCLADPDEISSVDSDQFNFLGRRINVCREKSRAKSRRNSTPEFH